MPQNEVSLALLLSLLETADEVRNTSALRSPTCPRITYLNILTSWIPEILVDFHSLNITTGPKPFKGDP